ncbi:AMP-binding protein [Parabacteroides pacaensis]|uniref:AMP-binding protein n=1 Tax=Parabacteroides pacaensis TaxID=2086575 RepID=UPI000D0E8241|nr:AMP-binding protein [Parabacteroides pacaensis]
MYHLNIKKQTITIEGTTYAPTDLLQLFEEIPANLPLSQQFLPFKHDLLNFLKEWFSDSPEITVHTSGSTGQPKPILVRKEQMMRSAEMTCTFLDLKEKDKTLLCLPLSYIAGKMIVVRSLIASLDLYPVTPSGHPLAETHTHFQFAAMIPLQVYNSFQNPEEKKKLEQIEKLIIGGSPIDYALQEKIATLPKAAYATYGMTETLSHIALQRLNGKEASSRYTPLPSVELSLSEEQTLTVYAPLVNDKKLTTNDIAHIYPDGSFKILGRKDNIIITGGIKIQIEEVESHLAPVISTPFAITSQPHPKFGEIVVLLVERPTDITHLEEKINSKLTIYQRPKKIYSVENIPLTISGKINRAATKQLAATL